VVEVSHPSKCEHGVYWPAADAINLGCQVCNPDGLPDGPVPVLPRSASDVLAQKTIPASNCVKCGNVRTYSMPNCRVCSTPFTETDLRGYDSPSNKKQPGMCPECSSTVHYETVKKSIWECSECGTKFKAPKEAEL